MLSDCHENEIDRSYYGLMTDTAANSAPKRTTRKRSTTPKATDATAAATADQPDAAEPQYFATRRNHFGVQLLDIGPVGWIGPVPLSVPVDRVPDLIKTLQAAIKLDEPEVDTGVSGVAAPGTDGTTKPLNSGSDDSETTVTTADSK